MSKGKKKSKGFLVDNMTVRSTVWAVIIVVTVPFLYIVIFSGLVVNNAPKEKSVQGYLDQETCEMKSNSKCDPVTTVQEDQYWIPNE
jgi:hypothetical protein